MRDEGLDEEFEQSFMVHFSRFCVFVSVCQRFYTPLTKIGSEFACIIIDWDRAAVVITASKSMHERLQIKSTWQETHTIGLAALKNSLSIFTKGRARV